MPLDLRNTLPAEVHRGSVRPRATPRRVSGRPPAAANDQVALARESRIVDPMLLVYQERVLTFQLLVRKLRLGMASLLKGA